MNLLVLVVDDEPDVEVLFRQQFRRDPALARTIRNSVTDAGMPFSSWAPRSGSRTFS